MMRYYGALLVTFHPVRHRGDCDVYYATTSDGRMADCAVASWAHEEAYAIAELERVLGLAA